MTVRGRRGAVCDETERPAGCYRSLPLSRYFEYASDLARQVEPGRDANGCAVEVSTPITPHAGRGYQTSCQPIGPVQSKRNVWVIR